MSTLALRGVKKSYAAVQVLHSVDMEVQEGEFVVLVGPSGCGKSTMLRMIAGLEEVTEGEIRIDGRVVNNDTPKQRNIAMVFQNYALYPHMTVRQNIGINLEIAGVGKQDVERRVRAAAELLGIEDYLDRRPAQLSGGQRQRVAMGRAIVRDPAVFLFDEPLSNLDAKLRVQMRSEIKALQTKMPRTSIYVTHDQTEAMTLADRVVIMNQGRIEQMGTAMEVYSCPENTFVASFIGSPAMNIFETSIGSVDGAPAFELGGAQLPLPPGIQPSEPVLVGLRPEHIAIDPSGKAKAEVLYVEPMGAQTQVAARAGTQDLVIVCPGTTIVKTGETLGLTIAPDNIHVFSKATGKRL